MDLDEAALDNLKDDDNELAVDLLDNTVSVFDVSLMDSEEDEGVEDDLLNTTNGTPISEQRILHSPTASPMPTSVKAEEAPGFKWNRSDHQREYGSRHQILGN